MKILFTRCYGIGQSPVQVQTFPHYTHKKRTDIIISSQLPCILFSILPSTKLYVPDSGTSIYKKRTQSKINLESFSYHLYTKSISLINGYAGTYRSDFSTSATLCIRSYILYPYLLRFCIVMLYTSLCFNILNMPSTTI